jgi:hypothetical protein
VDKPSAQEKTDYQEKTAKACYREASCAAINFYDEAGERLQTLRFGRMPEAGKKTLKNQRQQSISTILPQQPELNLIKIADGAADNWCFLSDTLLPGQGVELLDYVHACDHLNAAMEASYGKGGATAIAKYQAYKSRLKMKLGALIKSLIP